MERDESERMRLTAALPVAIQSGWCAEEPVCTTEAWQIKLRMDSLDAERRGTSHREKEKAENFSAVSASAVTTPSIIPLIIINYYQRSRGPFTSSSQRGDSYTFTELLQCVCVCVCGRASFLCLPTVLSLFPTGLVWAMTSRSVVFSAFSFLIAYAMPKCHRHFLLLPFKRASHYG